MKHFAVKLGVICGAVLFFTGCAGMKELSASIGESANFDEVSACGLTIIRNKTTQNEVMSSIGAPSLVCKNDIGGETWIYQRVAVRSSDTGFGARVGVEFFFPFSASTFQDGAGLAGASVSSSVDSSRSSYKTSGLLIKFNSKGCVNHYEITGTSF